MARAVAPNSKALRRRCSGVIAQRTRTYTAWLGLGLAPITATILRRRPSVADAVALALHARGVGAVVAILVGRVAVARPHRGAADATDRGADGGALAGIARR